MTSTSLATETLLYSPVVPERDAVRMAWVYPAPYNVAMSSLGYLVLFRQMDENAAVAPRRIYADTLKQHHPSDYELMGFSFSFELDALQILETFKTWDIPFYARERGNEFPLMFAGGPVIMSNPEPYADFFDFFLIGEGEEMMVALVAAFQRHRDITDRAELLSRLAKEVPGIYVPKLFEVEYQAPDGPIAAIHPTRDDIPAVVEKQVVANLENFLAYSPILTPESVFSNTFLIEVMRGCAHRCRFCLASYTMLPQMGSGVPAARGASLEKIIETIELGLKYTRKIGLLGALIADHPQFPELCEWFNRQEGVQISAASLRADTLTPLIAETFAKGGQKQVTIAIESGSQRLRRRINKNLKHEQIMQAARTVAESGLQGLKLYGMVGLPDETEEDVQATVDLVREIHKENPRLKLHLGCSSFVPKAGTPFQWQPRLDNKLLDRRFEMLRKGTVKAADFRPQSSRWDYFQGVLSRGDRRLAPFIVRFYELGSSLGTMNRAYKQLQEEGVRMPSLDWYALRERPQEEVLPWDMISLGIPKHILYKEGLPPPGWSA